MLNKNFSSPYNQDPFADTQKKGGKCIIFIGMPGSGKSTLAKAMSQKLGWAYVDTDHILEAWYGLRLEELFHRLGPEDFLKAEERIVHNLMLNRCFIATGGSVIYSKKAMKQLSSMGLIIYLQAGYATIANRVSQQPERGLVIFPNQSLQEIYTQRSSLYPEYADLTIDTDKKPLQDCIQTITTWLYEKKIY